MTASRRRFLLAGGTLAATGLAGCLSSDEVDLPDEVPDTAVTNAPIPDSPGEFPYATMGTGEGKTVTYFGDWKCPHCANFSTNGLNTIASDYVQSGDLSLRFRAWNIFQNDDIRAAKAGLAVWNVDPDSFWPYHEYVMQNQPSESKEWATTEWLATAAEKVGVSDVEAVRSQTEDDQYDSQLQRNSNDAVNAGYGGTPTLVVGGTGRNPMNGDGSLNDPTRNALDELASK